MLYPPWWHQQLGRCELQVPRGHGPGLCKNAKTMLTTHKEKSFQLYSSLLIQILGTQPVYFLQFSSVFIKVPIEVSITCNKTVLTHHALEFLVYCGQQGAS